ncbi:MAG: ROK family protein [Phycisphaerales bacterium]|nr:ROK family protein [Phycisphaerales bacterium]
MPEVLSIDIGGSHVKLRVSSNAERRMFESGPSLTAQEMADGVKRIASDWRYERVSIGLPAPIVANKPLHDPVNLGQGWVEFDYDEDFGVPVKLINDAAMQAVGSYSGGRMLFLGLGTGLGSCLIADHAVLPMELAHLPYRKGQSFEDYVGIRGLKKLGQKRWRKHVVAMVNLFVAALIPDEVVLGGGNSERLKITELPPACRLGENANAFEGGFRLWRSEWEKAVPVYE